MDTLAAVTCEANFDRSSGMKKRRPQSFQSMKARCFQRTDTATHAATSEPLFVERKFLQLTILQPCHDGLFPYLVTTHHICLILSTALVVALITCNTRQVASVLAFCSMLNYIFPSHCFTSCLKAEVCKQWLHQVVKEVHLKSCLWTPLRLQ